MPYQKLGIEIAIDKVSLDATALQSQIATKLGAALSGLDTALNLKVKVSADTSAAKTEITELTGLVEKFKTALNEALQGNATRKLQEELDKVKKDLAELAKGAKVEVKADINKAREEVHAFKNVLADLNKGVKAEVKVDASKGATDLRQQFLKALDDIAKKFKDTKLDTSFGNGGFTASSSLAAGFVNDQVTKAFAADSKLSALKQKYEDLWKQYRKYEEAMLKQEANPKFDANNPSKAYLQNDSKAAKILREYREVEQEINQISAEIAKKLNVSASDLAKNIKAQLASDQIGGVQAAREIKLLIDEVARLRNVPAADLYNKLGLKKLNDELVTIKGKTKSLQDILKDGATISVKTEGTKQAVKDLEEVAAKTIEVKARSKKKPTSEELNASIQADRRAILEEQRKEGEEEQRRRAAQAPTITPSGGGKGGGGKGGGGGDDEDGVTSLAKRLAKAFDLPAEAADLLKQKLKNTLTMEGVELGSSKLKKVNDLMVSINGETSKLSHISEAVKRAFAANPDADIKIFSREKLDKEFKAFEQRVAELKDKAIIAGVPSTGLDALAKDTAAGRASRLSTPADLEKLKDQYIALNTAVGNDTKMKSVGKVLEGLGKQYASLGEEAQKVVAKVTGESFRNDAEGVAAYGRAVAAARKELEGLAASRKRAAEEQQRQMNEQAGTVGVEYKRFGEGYVRKAMDTSLGTDSKAYYDKFDTDAVRMQNNLRNVNQALHAVRADALRGVQPTIESISQALGAAKVFLGSLDNVSLNHLQDQLKKVNAEIKDGTVQFREQTKAVKDTESEWIKLRSESNLYSLANKNARINALEKSHPTLDVSGLRAQQGEIEALVGSKTAADVALTTHKLQLLSTAIATVKAEASGQVTVTFASQLQKAVELAYQRIGDLTLNSKATASALNSAMGDLGIKLDSQAKIDAATSAFRKYNNEIQNGTVVAKQANNAFGILGDQLGKMATRLVQFYALRTVLFAIGNQIREATAAAIDFNQSMYDIIAISGDSRDQMREIGDSIWDIAKASRFSAKEVSDLVQILAQAGVKSEALPLVSKQVGIFATATATDPKLAGDLVTTSMNVYGIDADHTIRITNALTAALNNSKLEASGLATAFNYLAPQAAQLGYSMEQTLGIISTMAQSGIKPSTIGTGTSQMLKEFAAPKKRLLNMLDYYGLSPDDVNPLKHTFAEIVDALNNARGKSNEMGVSVDHLFRALETRVGRSTVAAINLGGDAFRAMELSITNTSAALIAYDKSMEGARARMNVLKQTLHELVSGSLEKMSPMLIGLGNAMRGFLNIFTPTGAAILGVASALGILTLAIAGLQKIVANFAVVKTGTNLLSLLLGGFASAPTLAVVAALGAIGYGIYKLGIYFDQTKQKEEEARKKRIETVEANQKMIDVLNMIRTANETASASEADKVYEKTKQRTASLREYNDLMALHGERLKNLTQAEREAMLARGELNKHEKQIVELGQKRVNITTAERAALESLIAKKPELFEGIQKEINLYTNLAQVLERLNRAKFRDSINAMNSYNAIFDSVEKDMSGIPNLQQVEKIIAARIEKNRGKKKDGIDIEEMTDPTQLKLLQQDAAQLRTVRGIIAQKQSRIKDLDSEAAQALREQAFAGSLETVVPHPDKKGKTALQIDSVTSEPRILAPGVTRSRLMPTITIDIPKDTKGLIEDRNTKTEQSVATDLLPGLTISNLQDAKNTLLRLKDEAITKEAIIGYYKRIEAIDNQIANMERGKETNQVAKQVKPGMSSDPNKVRTSSLKPDFLAMVKQENEEHGTKYSAVDYYKMQYAQAQAKEEGARQKAVEDRKKGQTAALEKIEKVQRDFRQKLADLDQRDADQIMAKQQANYEKVISSSTASEERKAEALVKAKELAGKRIEDAAKAEADKLIEDFYKPENAAVATTSDGFNRMVQHIDKIYSKVPQLKAEENLRLDTSAINNSTLLQSEFLEKQADRVLRLTQERLTVQKELATSADQIHDLELEGLDAEITNAQAKERMYKTDLDRGVAKKKQLLDELEQAKLKKEPLEVQQAIQEKIDAWDAKHLLRLNETKEKYEEILLKLGLLKRRKDEVENDGFGFNFKKGWDDQAKTIGTWSQFYQREGGIAFDGVSSAFEGSLKTIFNPDRDKISGLKKQIGDLKGEKSQLESDISAIEGNTTRTPQENANLADKKQKLAEINGQLSEQTKQLKQATNAWAALKDGLVNAVKSMIDALIKYVAQLIAVWVVEKMLMVFGGAAKGGQVTDAGVTDTSGKYFTPDIKVTAAGGGMIPLAMGKPGIDSVPALLMPGEIVLQRSAVEYYGSDTLLALNQKKIKKFAEGGMVGATSTEYFNPDSKEIKRPINLSIINVADPSSVPKMTGQEVINIVTFNAAQRGEIYKTIKAVVDN